MAENGTILVIEDDEALAMGLTDALEFEGYRVVAVRTGAEGVLRATREAPDCVILDLMLPDRNGFDVCADIRRTHPLVPILMLTARSAESDKVRGLDAGADDYVTKPFGVGELVARIRAILRRARRGGVTASSFRIGDAVVEPASHTVRRGRQTHALTFYEIELLKLLHERAGQVVSRDEMLERIWGVPASPTNRSVDNFVVRLRRKIEPQPDRPRHIVTVHGVGYKLVP
ncbi:MAG: response regulator transcription factor [Myxococcota bacterium]|nr:response regulator transcription factor [Myxococcota bacterium]MDW8364078.1 response regulator transcription factor [Myxococcales bacterium]